MSQSVTTVQGKPIQASIDATYGSVIGSTTNRKGRRTLKAIEKKQARRLKKQGVQI